MVAPDPSISVVCIHARVYTPDNFCQQDESSIPHQVFADIFVSLVTTKAGNHIPKFAGVFSNTLLRA